MSEERHARDLPKRAADELVGLDILVVNAGHQKYFNSFDELTSDDFDTTMRANLHALFWTTQEAARIMPPGASIITTLASQEGSYITGEVYGVAGGAGIA